MSNNVIIVSTRKLTELDMADTLAPDTVLAHSQKSRFPTNISLRLLTALLFAFFLGGASYAILLNALNKELTTFSTTSLIGFVISILLSGASIILAIVAIILGKSSEDAMTTRSDSSIHLQNQIFQRTIDALQRIESSTGVTEKRVEDIIAGRVASVSQKIAAEVATEKRADSRQVQAEDIEKILKRSLLDRNWISHASETSPEHAAKEEREKAERNTEVKYQSDHTEALRAFAMRNDLKAIKLGHGSPDQKAERLFDGLFVRADGKKIAMSTFRKDATVYLQQFIPNALRELHQGAVEQIYMILFETNPAMERVYESALSIIAPELAGRMALLVCPAEQINEKISSLNVGGTAQQLAKKEASAGVSSSKQSG